MEDPELDKSSIRLNREEKSKLTINWVYFYIQPVSQNLTEILFLNALDLGKVSWNGRYLLSRCLKVSKIKNTNISVCAKIWNDRMRVINCPRIYRNPTVPPHTDGPTNNVFYILLSIPKKSYQFTLLLTCVTAQYSTEKTGQLRLHLYLIFFYFYFFLSKNVNSTVKS